MPFWLPWTGSVRYDIHIVMKFKKKKKSLSSMLHIYTLRRNFNIDEPLEILGIFSCNIKGGNWSVPEGLINSSTAQVSTWCICWAIIKVYQYKRPDLEKNVLYTYFSCYIYVSFFGCYFWWWLYIFIIGSCGFPTSATRLNPDWGAHGLVYSAWALFLGINSSLLLWGRK